MAELIILGSASAVPGMQQENTHLAIREGERLVLVDCAGGVVMRLQQAGLPLLDIHDIILTHFHPDHVSGAALLLMDLWLLGRTAPVTVHGLAHTLERFERMLELYDWQKWPGFFPLYLQPVEERENAPVLEDAGLRILASPVRHLLPTIGLRFEFPHAQKTVAYSCDTEPCPQVTRLAAGADVLIHEATGAGVGHSSAAQAGHIARQAEVGRLLLIHYTPAEHGGDNEKLVAEARQAFQGSVELAQDFQRIKIEPL